MIERIVSETFKRIAHQWTIGGVSQEVTEKDVEQVLDHAAKVMYDRDTNDRLETGGLIIEKTSNGYDVYMYVGNYN